MKAWLPLAGILAAASVGCQGVEAPRELPALDRHAYRCTVAPVLAARCSYGACHGDPQRPFLLYARGRLRLDVPPEAATRAELSATEVEANWNMTIGLARDERLAGPLLLAKPLAVEAGGYCHGATNMYGGADVFVDGDDEGYRAVLAWIGGETADATCAPTGEVGP